jgi:hypothetical protein
MKETYSDSIMDATIIQNGCLQMEAIYRMPYPLGILLTTKSLL